MKLKFFTASLPSENHPEENQDAWFVDQKEAAAGVFDGVGGFTGGKEAANWASQCFKDRLVLESLERTFNECHVILKEKGQEAFGHEIGTTVAVVKLYPREAESLVIWGSVGDSRIYQFSSQRLLPVSVDDSLVVQALEKRWLTAAKADRIDQAESLKGLNKIEAGLFKSRHIITQALGLGLIKPRIGKFKAKTGEMIILTTDGIHANLTNKHIEQILQESSANPAQELVKAAAAVSQGTSLRANRDDITVVVVKLI